MSSRQLFFDHIAQTSPSPLAIEVVKAEGSYITDADDKQYLDLIAGISVANTGHRHPKVVKAIKKQLDQYMHVLVYGEMIESPQVQYAALLTKHLPESLNTVYFTNSGAEATEGAMKLAKRASGRAQMVAFNHSYHGSTQGALSVIGDEYWRNAFRPLLPGIHHGDYNDFKSLDLITSDTACVIAETIQAERGVFAPDPEWILALRQKCNETGTLLIFDAIQTGFGRTGSLWGFEQSGVIPDILLLGKALGGGLPLGAFIASHGLMSTLSSEPVLGHITTFGGHPVSCAAGLAAFNVLLKKDLLRDVISKRDLFTSLLKHEKIRTVRAEGLLIAVEFESFEVNKQVIDNCIQRGVLTDWFLFAPHCMRIAPPLTIQKKDIRKACEVILGSI